MYCQCADESKCTASTAAEVRRYNNPALTPYFPYLSFITQEQTGVLSNYDALQVTATGRSYHGLSYIAGYTYVHALDDNPVSLPANPGNLRQNYGNGVADIRNRLSFSLTYLIPGVKSPGQMLKGWSVSPLVLIQSGMPWTAADLTSDDVLGTGENHDGGNVQTWNYTGPASAFTSGPNPIPCYGAGSGCTPFASAPAAIQQQCTSAAAAFLHLLLMELWVMRAMISSVVPPITTSIFLQAELDMARTTRSKNGIWVSDHSAVIRRATRATELSGGTFTRIRDAGG